MASSYETTEMVIHPSLTRTASFNTEHFRSIDYTTSAGIFYIDVTAVSGTTPTLTAQLQTRDPASQKWVNITWAVTASIIATGTYTLTVWSSLTAVANSVVNYPLPTTLRIAYTIGGTTPSFTFSAGVTFSA